MDEADFLRQNFDHVLARIHNAALNAGRDPALVRLVAVSKFHPAQMVASLAEHWIARREAATSLIPPPAFGENYIQEALPKEHAVAEILRQKGINSQAVHWHFTGRLQSNKIKQAVGRFSLIHTLDSEKTARNLHNILSEESGANSLNAKTRIQKVLIQVNSGAEAQKGGVAEDSAISLAQTVARLDTLELLGFMCLPPLAGEGEASRPYFAALRRLRDRAAVECGLSLPVLSMGMSGDLEQAVEEGATLVRVGTDIFGPRPARP